MTEPINCKCGAPASWYSKPASTVVQCTVCDEELEANDEAAPWEPLPLGAIDLWNIKMAEFLAEP
jgi:hypothetical protein